ncbi:MAG: hypothetical protein WA945_09680 [Arcobacteraceae bacterium]
MKKLQKSLLLAAALLFSTNAIADDNNNQKSYKQQKEHKYHGYKNHDKKERRAHRGDETRFFIGTVYDLKLTKQQEEKIDTILKEFKNKRFDRFKSFKKDGFDKDEYIKARMKSKEDKIKQSAELIEKVYAVLTKDQIEAINVKLTQFKNMKKKRGKNGSCSHDRG